MLEKEILKDEGIVGPKKNTERREYCTLKKEILTDGGTVCPNKKS